MSFGELIKPEDTPVKPEIEKIDLSAQYLECLTGQSKRPWSDILDEMEEKYEGKNTSFVMRLRWEEIPEGKKIAAANGLKALLDNANIGRKAECIIVINKTEKESLKKSYNSEFMNCYNAFASGVKLEEVD
ncbi:MAG: hypothetical protein WCT50_00090 [Patescibacteria group bacterium]